MNAKILKNVLDVASRLVLTISLLLVLAPPALAQETLPNQGVFSPSVWAPQTAKWENGLPRGYAETESAALAVVRQWGVAAGSAGLICPEDPSSPPSGLRRAGGA